MEKKLNVTTRTEYGKNQSRRIRNSGFIPAVVYSHGESESIKVPKKEFLNLFVGKVSESVIFDVNITDKKKDSEQMVFVKDYQTDPISGEIVHLDLFKVTAGEKIHTNVPINYTGVATGIKLGGVLEVSERDLEIECLPKDLPGKIDVDVTELEVGDSIHVRDLELDDKINIFSNPETVLVAVHLIKIAVVEEEEEEEIGELEEGVEAEDEKSEDDESKSS